MAKTSNSRKGSSGKVVPLLPRGAARGRVTQPKEAVSAEAALDAIQVLASKISSASTPAEALRLQLGIAHALFEARTSFVAELVPSRNVLAVSCVRGRNDARVQ